jgi:terminase small subunit / prophage DNA-packing protein
VSSDCTIRFVNKIQLETLFDKSLPTIEAWIRKGVPFVQKGDKAKEWQFDASAVAKWREEHVVAAILGNTKDVEFEAGRRRKIAAEAGILEIELQEKRREVIATNEVAQGLAHAYLTLKQRLRTIPERVVHQVIAEDDEQICRELLLHEIDDALLELSQLDFDDRTTEKSEQHI